MLTRSSGDRHVSAGHLNFIGSNTTEFWESALSSCRHWALAISRLSPILHWRPGLELRQEGRLGQQLRASRSRSRKTHRIPLTWAAYQTHAKERAGGGDGNNCLLRRPPKPSPWGLGLVWPSFPAFSFPGCQVCRVTKTILLSLEHFLLRCLQRTFQIHLEGIFIHQGDCFETIGKTNTVGGLQVSWVFFLAEFIHQHVN